MKYYFLTNQIKESEQGPAEPVPSNSDGKPQEHQYIILSILTGWMMIL